MEWFKFYGKDWLTDTKILDLSVEDRLCYLTLLCLASASEEQGVIKKCNEESIIRLTQLYNDPYETDNSYTRARGFLKRLHDNGMITNDNNDNITVVAFTKRQCVNLSGYERLKKYREKKKTLINQGLNENDNNDNVHDNTMITLDKIRIDKNIPVKTGKNMKSINYDTNEYEEEETKTKRTDVINLAKLFDKMATDYTGKPIITPKSYFIVLNAVNKHKMKPKGIEQLFKDWFADPKITNDKKVNLSYALSAGNLNAFKVKN